MRQQEKMIQDMEKAVYRREAIMFRSGAALTTGQTVTTLCVYMSGGEEL